MHICIRGESGVEATSLRSFATKFKHLTVILQYADEVHDVQGTWHAQS